MVVTRAIGQRHRDSDRGGRHLWADEAGDFVVSVRVDDSDEWETFDVSGREGDCYGVEARVTDDGGQGVWYEEDPDSCTAAEMSGDG